MFTYECRQSVDPNLVIRQNRWESIVRARHRGMFFSHEPPDRQLSCMEIENPFSLHSLV